MPRKAQQKAAPNARMPALSTSRQNVVFFHPDLGIGGAERLIIDAAVSLQNLGHTVTIYTSHRDVSHCFDEARDGTLDVRVRGASIFPATLVGRFKILLTILRHIHLLLSIYLSGELAALSPQVFFLDQLSAGIPLLRFLFPNVPILFYCHFPDLLLVQRRSAWVRRVWRFPFDALEGWSMRGADRVVVNSAFTRSVVQGVWPGLGKDGEGRSELGIVYPCVDTDTNGDEVHMDEQPLWADKKVILSINRFERKKDIGLAIRAFAQLDDKVRSTAKLVVAGGYDARESENVSYHADLVSLCESHGLKCATAKNVISALDTPSDVEVLFLLSVPSSLKSTLLRTAKLLVYTPRNEHFGIVPLEAMLARTPVLASNTGGPLETVIDGKTGWLRDADDIPAWTAVMHLVLADLDERRLKDMGAAGRVRVQAEFSKAKMGTRLEAEIQGLVGGKRVSTLELVDLFFWGFTLLGLLAAGVGFWFSGGQVMYRDDEFDE